MSYCSDVVLILLSSPREGVMEKVNSFKSKRGEFYLAPCAPSDEGSQKVFCSRVYTACANYLPVYEYIAHVHDALKGTPHALIISSEGEGFAGVIKHSNIDGLAFTESGKVQWVPE